MCVYSLAPGVSFDLLQHLYKLEHHTSLCCRASDICTVGQIYALWARYRHCGADIGTAGLSVMKTRGAQATNQLKHPIVRDPSLGCFN